MRIACEVVFIRMTAGPRPQQKASKGQKAFVVLEKLRKTPIIYQITFSVVGDKTGNKFLLDKPPQIVSHLLQQGKITLNFQSKPPVSVLVSKANPDDLALLIEYITKIGKGEVVDVTKVKIKSSDFKPSQIHVKHLSDYNKQRASFSEFLKIITFDAIDLKIPDKKWATCVNLTRLTLNGNPFATNFKDIDVLTKLTNLQILEMNNCRLGTVPWTKMRDVFKKLSRSIRVLDLCNNALMLFPPIFHLRDLRSLNISNNQIQYLPSRIGFLRQLTTIDASGNRLTALPYVFTWLPNMQTVSISGNEELIRLAADEEPPTARRILGKIDGHCYTHPGGVDTLRTMAANSLLRIPEVMTACRPFLPLCLRFHVDDLIYEDPTVSAVEMCTNCRKMKHIRYVRTVLTHSRTIANSVDVIDRFVAFNHLYCIDCYHPPQGHTLPLETDFFQHSI